MIRIVAENIVLFLLPTLVYVLYTVFRRRMDGAPTTAATVFDDAPVIWLFFAGALLVVATLVFFGSTSGGRPGEAYVPPSVIDGKITPGRLEHK
jgi:phosphoglycerol transferase MdoB-like AlkP superfamily enzyme